MNRRLPTQWVPGLIALLLLALWPAISARATNLALGKPAFASWNSPVAGTGTDATANLTDGNFTTAWNNAGSPNTGNDQAGVDLGAIKSFHYVRLNWTADHATAFTVEVGDAVDTDPTSFFYGTGDWSIVYTRTTDPAGFNTGRDFIDIGAQSHRYVRIAGTVSSNTSTVWGINELQVLDVVPTISGTVSASGSPVANALVALSGPTDSGNPAPFLSSSVVSDANGHYIINGVDPGTYTLTGSKPGKFGPSQVPGVVVGATGTVTQDITLTTTVSNVTASMPAYNLDYIAGPGDPTGQANANANSLALPADELPTGNAVWATSTALPAGGTIGPNLSQDLSFFFPPTANGSNNVVSAENAVIPFPNGHYTSIYVMQVAGDAPYYTNATLNYTDGSSTVVATSSGNTLYAFHTGTSAPGEDEVAAITVDKLYNVGNGTTDTAPGDVPYTIFVRTILVDKTKALANLTFGGIQAGPGSMTTSKGHIIAYSADTIDTPQARGSITGTITGPAGQPVTGALVKYLSYQITTGASGTYAFNGIPAGAATITASKPANFAAKSTTITLTAGQNAIVNIQFLAPIPVVTDPLSGPNWDMVSTDANYGDFTATGWMLGREYIPTGLFSPDVPGSNTPSNTTFIVNTGAPSALPFDFGDIKDTPILTGQPGYPAGGTPCGVVLQGAQFLAPPAQITNVYFVESGIEGSCSVQATLHYADGTFEKKIAAVSDWFGSSSPNELPYLIMRGRHSRTGEANVGGSIKLNALVVPVNSAKQLQDVTFYEASQPQVYPSVLALAWETTTQQPASSDIEVVVKNADNTPAAGALVNLGFYNTKADANGVAVFRGIPAGLTIGVGAFIPGVTKQARVDGHLVPSGKKYSSTGTDNADIINLTLNGGAPINVGMQLAYNFDMLSNADMPGDYACRASFQNDWGMDEAAMTFPSNGTTTYPGLGSMVFNTPHRETGFNNVLRQNGQTATVVPGHYSSLSIVDIGAGVGGDHPTLFFVTFNYADGTSEQVQYTTQDWVLNFTTSDVANVNLFFRTYWAGSSNNPFYSPNRRNYDGGVQALGVAGLANVLPVNAGKVLTSFTLLPILRDYSNDDQEIFAATLEANDLTGTAGTITGTVTGQPLGAASAGPIANAMVSVDAFHGVYTDASGNFTLTNVPTGPATITVLPYGTGILTKTFPVTVASGANAVGTLSVGAAVTQVSCVLGATNTESGLHQIEGNVLPYGYSAPDSQTIPVTVQGNTARQTLTNGTYIYFRVDPGWLYRGKISDQGLTVVGAGTPTQTIPKLAPDTYVRIEYLDRGTDTFRIQFNTMEKDTAAGFDSIRMTNAYTNGNGPIGNLGNTFVTKTGTNTWKTFTYHLDPTVAGNAFGAYHGENLHADFRISGRSDGLPEIIRSVVVSVSPNIVPPVAPAGAADILRVYGGLQAAPLNTPSSMWPTYDLNGDGVVNFKDAIKSVKP
ncbi:MAG TPA: carboxypeptidase regulatory-like domain-containing protein [Armatimonadota bacterium]|jgi:hypothetical protein